jgi:hypothetical protein
LIGAVELIALAMGQVVVPGEPGALVWKPRSSYAVMMPVHQGLDRKVAAGTPGAGAVGQRVVVVVVVVGVAQVVPRDLGTWMRDDSVVQGQQRKRSSRDKRLRAEFPSDSMGSNLSWMLSLQQPGVGRKKVGRTIEFTRLQSIVNIDRCLAEQFVILLLFREDRYRKRSVALRWILRDGKAKLHIPDRVLAALGVHRSLFSGAAESEFDVGILLVKGVVVDEMLSFEDDDDECAQFLGHRGQGRKMMAECRGQGW